MLVDTEMAAAAPPPPPPPRRDGGGRKPTDKVAVPPPPDDSSSSEDEATVKAAKELLRRVRKHKAKKNKVAAGGITKEDKDSTPGPARRTPCLGCVRSALTRSRELCHDSLSLRGDSGADLRCFDCSRHNHPQVAHNPFWDAFSDLT